MPVRGAGLGTRVNAKGYVQITRRGPTCWKLEHRVVMADLCQEWCYYPLSPDGLPEGMEVHHVDFIRTHNCRCNLLLLDPTLHFHMDIHIRRRPNGTYARPAPTVANDSIPDWVTREEREEAVDGHRTYTD